MIRMQTNVPKDLLPILNHFGFLFTVQNILRLKHKYTSMVGKLTGA